MYFGINIVFYHLKFYNNKDIITERRNYIETIIMEKKLSLVIQEQRGQGREQFP